jgi:hypothetical protein
MPGEGIELLIEGTVNPGNAKDIFKNFLGRIQMFRLTAVNYWPLRGKNLKKSCLLS